MTWTILETTSTQREVPRLPLRIREKYEAWKAIVRQDGPAALRNFPGTRDEALGGAWAGYRSSRLSQQYRVIYRVDAGVLTVVVVRVSAHDYRRR